MSLLMIGPAGNLTFSVFVTASASVAQSANARVYVTLVDPNGNTIGITSIGAYTD